MSKAADKQMGKVPTTVHSVHLPTLALNLYIRIQATRKKFQACQGLHHNL